MPNSARLHPFDQELAPSSLVASAWPGRAALGLYQLVAAVVDEPGRFGGDLSVVLLLQGVAVVVVVVVDVGVF